ncbi:MAG: hypothetical protein IRY95_09775, partial [Clostridia bacterium]|nr:hypothetical protein [Clostridia bacterium]
MSDRRTANVVTRLSAGLAGLAVLAVLTLTSACSTPARQPGGTAMRQQAKALTIDLADDPDVQRAFVQGRRANLDHPDVGRRMLEEGLEEERRTLRDSRLGTEAAILSAETMQKGTSVPEARARMMAATVDLLEGVVRDDRLRPRLVQAMMSLFSDPAMQRQMMSMMKAMGGGTG